MTTSCFFPERPTSISAEIRSETVKLGRSLPNMIGAILTGLLFTR
ncbi:hypothetical protein [Burkholderia gladioli]|nr:hypothetical protein [Burkholderia gladioli]